jgi:hypothetical protein
LATPCGSRGELKEPGAGLEDLIPNNGRMEEKLKESILGELKRQAANRPQSLKVEGTSEELVVHDKIAILPTLSW